MGKIMNQSKKSNGWGMFFGTILAFILAIAAFWGTTRYISDRIQYLDADIQREFIIPDISDVSNP